jgi:hypothetical protein
VFANVTVNPGDLVYMSYLIVNAGHSPPDAIESALESAGGKLATAAGAAAAGAVVGSGVPVIGTVVGAVTGFLAGELESIFTADCDGTVAAEYKSSPSTSWFQIPRSAPSCGRSNILAPTHRLGAG